jgi:hypothetical protein
MNLKKAFQAPQGKAEELDPQKLLHRAEAARYAVLRRLAPCLRHHMVRNLQPISMIYEIIDHRRAVVKPDMPTLYNNADKINGYAKAALQECLDVSSWLAPDTDEVIAVGNGVRDCVELMSASLNFRGYHLINEVGNPDLYIRRDILRMLLTASFMAATDALSEAAKLVLKVLRSNGQSVELEMLVEPVNDGLAEIYDDGYRKIVWSDVEALARGEDVSLSRQGNRVVMGFAVQPSVAAH